MASLSCPTVAFPGTKISAFLSRNLLLSAGVLTRTFSHHRSAKCQGNAGLSSLLEEATLRRPLEDASNDPPRRLRKAMGLGKPLHARQAASDVSKTSQRIVRGAQRRTNPVA
eukprot:scaffold602_cov298-Pinguiococcus_pyrenoidosus.AAC.17